jgi:hypothetical protein
MRLTMKVAPIDGSGLCAFFERFFVNLHQKFRAEKGNRSGGASSQDLDTSELQPSLCVGETVL